jgi:hypothetical protein
LHHGVRDVFRHHRCRHSNFRVHRIDHHPLLQAVPSFAGARYCPPWSRARIMAIRARTHGTLERTSLGRPCSNILICLDRAQQQPGGTRFAPPSHLAKRVTLCRPVRLHRSERISPNPGQILDPSAPRHLGPNFNQQSAYARSNTARCPLSHEPLSLNGKRRHG